MIDAAMSKLTKTGFEQMPAHADGPSHLRNFGSAAKRFFTSRSGVAAVEFAFVAPLLLSLYFVTMEVSQAIEVNKKVGRVGSMVADLLTQQQTIAKSEVDSVLKIGEAILQPYNRSKVTITATAIQISDEVNPKVTVAWSRKISNGATSAGAAKNSTTTVPTKLKIRNSFLIRVESDLAYKPVITWAASQKTTLGLAAAFDGIDMAEKYYLRPRMSSSVPCADC